MTVLPSEAGAFRGGRVGNKRLFSVEGQGSKGLEPCRCSSGHFSVSLRNGLLARSAKWSDERVAEEG